MIEILLLIIFLIGFLTIALEETLKMNKAKSALFFGTLGWIILFLSNHGSGEVISHAFDENLLEIASLWLFLICAMTFVAYMDKRGIIENTVYQFLPEKISEKKLMLVMGIFTFFFSAVADNLTATLISLTIILALKIEKEKLLKYAVLIIFAANAGGVALITGDVTTLMIFLAGKVTMTNLIWLMIPSFVAMMSLYLMLMRGVKGEVKIIKEDKKVDRVDYIIGGIFFATIVCIILGHVVYHIPPVLLFLFGLSVMFMIGWIHIHHKKKDLKLLEYIREAEFDALFFFLGVLLLVGMLKEAGILAKLTILYDIIPTHMANYFIGILSSVVDNIPLTAAMLKADLAIDAASWLSLTYAVGVGGSLLVIGSAAGVVAMSKISGLTFTKYLKYTLPVFVAYTIGFIGTYFMSIWIV